MVTRIHNDSVTLLDFDKFSLKLRHLLKRLVDADRSELIEVVDVDSMNRLRNVIGKNLRRTNLLLRVCSYLTQKESLDLLDQAY